MPLYGNLVVANMALRSASERQLRGSAAYAATAATPASLTTLRLPFSATTPQMVMTSRHARQQRIGTKVAFLSVAWIACPRVVDSSFVIRQARHAIGAHHCVKRLYIFFNYLCQLSSQLFCFCENRLEFFLEVTILRLPYGKIANHAHKRCGYCSNECGRASAARCPFLTRQIVQKELNGIVFDHCCSLRHTFSQRVDLFDVQDLI